MKVGKSSDGVVCVWDDDGLDVFQLWASGLIAYVDLHPMPNPLRAQWDEPFQKEEGYIFLDNDPSRAPHLVIGDKRRDEVRWGCSYSSSTGWSVHQMQPA